MTSSNLSLRRLILLLSLLPAFASAQSNAATSPPCADTTARPMLLVFSGSDWCLPCIRFEKKVLSDSVFRAYAAKHLTVQKADFPQRKKLSAAEQGKNEQLAERYNPDGKFPHLVLLHTDGTTLAVLPTDAADGSQFVAQLKTHLPQ